MTDEIQKRPRDYRGSQNSFHGHTNVRKLPEIDVSNNFTAIILLVNSVLSPK